MHRPARQLFTILRGVLSLALIGLVLRALDWHSVLPIVSALHAPLALAASALSGLLLSLLALRWMIFLRQRNLRLPFSAVLPLSWAGQFFNSVLPGSIGGDGVKIYELCRRYPTQKAAATSTIVLDRLSALVALALLALPAVLLDPVPLRALGWGKISTGLAAVIALLGLGGMIGGGFWIARQHGSHGLARKIREVLSSVRTSLASGRACAAAVALSLAIHLLNFSTIFLFARALGLAITYPQILLMLPVVLVFLLLPITINGHGLREVLLIAYFTHFAIQPPAHLGGGFKEAAVALSLVLVANDLLWGLPGGLLYLLRPKTLPNPETPVPLATSEIA